MQENLEENNDLQNKSVEDLFVGVQESYAQAQQRALEENKSFSKTEFFRMDKMGTYRIRILPIAPKSDGTTDRTGYEYPVHQLLLELEKPSTGGKPSYMYVTVPRATDADYSIDIIDTYRKLAIAQAKDAGDEKLAEKIGGGSFGGGLKFNYGHALYMYDMSERAKGLQLLTLSHAQFKDLDDKKFKLWQKKLSKNQGYPCPISSVYNAYPVEIEKKKSGSKTEYAISIDNESDVDMLAKEELAALMATTRIPEIIYRYSRYQFEATIEYLKQCDAKFGMKLTESVEMKEAIEKLQNELPKEDTSSFSFDKRTKDAKDNSSSNEISLDNLIVRVEELEEQGLGDKTEEGQELRTMIRAYIEQEKLSIRVTRTTTNSDLLDLIEETMQGGSQSRDDNAKEQESAEESTESDDAAIETRKRKR